MNRKQSYLVSTLLALALSTAVLAHATPGAPDAPPKPANGVQVPKVGSEIRPKDLTPEDNESFGITLYENGDYNHAPAWLRQAANVGRAKAQYYLGRMNMTGQGMRPDPGEAAKWFARAARRGYLPAFAELGIQEYNSDQRCNLFGLSMRNRDESCCARLRTKAPRR